MLTGKAMDKVFVSTETCMFVPVLPIMWNFLLMSLTARHMFSAYVYDTRIQAYC